MGTDTVPPDDALEGELAALRARAYGVDADIEDDPRAAARLADLEAWHAAGAHAPLVVPSDDSSPDVAPNDVAWPDHDLRTADPWLAHDATTDAEADEPDPPTDPERPIGVTSRVRSAWTKARRGRIGSFVAGAAAVAAVALVVASWSALESPQPDAVLREVPDRPGEQVLRLADYARMLLVDESTLQAHEAYRGLQVWSATSVLGNRCLLAIEPSSDRLLGADCVPQSTDPTIAIYDVPVRALDPWHEGLPRGTVVRFVLTGDVVTVWVYEGSPPA